MAQILNSPSGTFCQGSGQLPDVLCFFLSGKMTTEILRSAPDSLTMKGDGHSRPLLPLPFSFSCLNVCPGSSPGYTPIHHSSPLAIFGMCSVPYRLQSSHKLFYFLTLSFYPDFPNKAHVSSKPNSNPHSSPQPPLLVYLSLCNNVCLYLPWMSVNYGHQSPP